LAPRKIKHSFSNPDVIVFDKKKCSEIEMNLIFEENIAKDLNKGVVKEF